ncbi:hypothetical protein ATANTOWER_013727 [Ataeniobius toweri]|uniref:Uncharacterized protein n=1 Tax=Ataeniobius toweri TaxID=208326 RepID=A0ABU7AFU8_9TELE|nr:hypothetical protein [Ataeniobius toweri]
MLMERTSKKVFLDVDQDLDRFHVSSSSTPAVQRGHHPVWPSWRLKLLCDWLEPQCCSKQSHEPQTGIACLRQKHGASCQLLSLRSVDWEMENMA